ncbi:uncharacterized protein LOC135477609 [Liolophura sinensis]|uniref:uncharacterized protein LOC135477609 n=1 Tax=Liolophura sinensis TaxID=3198878 RepID=UPI0031590F45
MIRKLLICTVVLFTACQAEIITEYCSDGSENTHSLGEEWEEGDKLCECIYPESLLYFWEGDNPSAPISHCLWNGCPNPSGGPIFKAGDVFQNENGDLCTCKSGSDPYLMDAYTLFHADCSVDLSVQELGV